MFVFGYGPGQVEPLREQMWALLTDGIVVKAQRLKAVWPSQGSERCAFIALECLVSGRKW